MRQQFVHPVGEDFIAISLPAGEAQGVIIDNPSGSWLHAFPLYDYVPPYTLGWTRTFQRAASIDVRFENGPAGQLSTMEAGPVTVYLDSREVGYSEGNSSSFIDKRGQPEQGDGSALFAISSTQTILAAPTTGRWRIYQVSARSMIGAVPRPVDIIEISVFSAPNSANVGAFVLGPNILTYTLPMPYPIDMPVGDSIDATVGFLDPADSGVLVQVRAAVI